MKLLISFLLWAVSAAALAAPLTSQMATFLITEENGKEVASATEQASPGDVIEYRLTYQNTGDNPLSGLVITGPIPANTAYVENSAATDVDATFTVSIDNGNLFHAEPVMQEVKGDDGETQNVPVSPDAYTQVRWQPQGSLQPGAQQEYRYRVQVQ